MLARIAHYLASHLTRAGRARRAYVQAVMTACVNHWYEEHV